MIQVTYLIPFTGGSDQPTQLFEAQTAPLNQGEITLLGLLIASDVTTWSGTQFERQVQFTETPEFIARIGLPFSAAKRKAAVTGLFSYKLQLELRKKVAEQIVLF